MTAAPGGTARARDLLENGAYREAAEMFVATGELASAARAFVCAKDYPRAAECYERARKPLDAARLYLQIRSWKKAADLYAQAGDGLRAELAREQYTKEQEALQSGGGGGASAGGSLSDSQPPAPEAPAIQWPQGEVWQAISRGESNAAVQLYLKGGNRGWELLEQAASAQTQRALGETLLLARDHTVAAEAFRKGGDMLRAAQCLSLAGLDAEAADLFVRSGKKMLAAQHLEKARAWEQAAALYVEENQLLEAARCHEKDDDPVKAAALYLKARQPDLALPLLQSVAPTHRSFAQCRILAGKILFQKGQKDLAVSLLSPLLETPLKSEEDLETYYQLAVLLDHGGAVDRAFDAYRRLQETRFGFKDVAQRLAKVQSAPPPPAQPSAPAPRQADAATPAVDLSPLRDCSLFNRLGLEELRRLWMIGRTGECKPGYVLLRAGQVSEGLILVLSGGLTITPDPGHPTAAVGFLGPGDYVGLGSLIKGPPQPNALVTQQGTRLLLLPLKSLESLLSTDPELGMRFFRSVAEHLVQTLMAEKAKPPIP